MWLFFILFVPLLWVKFILNFFKIFIKNLKNAVRAPLVLLIHDCGSNLWTINFHL